MNNIVPLVLFFGPTIITLLVLIPLNKKHMEEHYMIEGCLYSTGTPILGFIILPFAAATCIGSLILVHLENKERRQDKQNNLIQKWHETKGDYRG